MTVKPQIKTPCPEDWNKMKIGLHSRFCENCQKEVVDFTNKSRQEILEYLLANYNKRVCGRLYPSQLDFSHSDFMVTIRALEVRTSNTNLAFYLLTLGTLVLSGCSSGTPASQVQNSLPVSAVSTLPGQTLKEICISEPADTLKKKKDADVSRHSGATVGKVMVIDTPQPLTGVVMMPLDTTPDFPVPYDFVEVMPEFKGGIDSLLSFVKQNLKYPDWERKQKIEGKVFVSFVVDKEGKIKDARIIKSVEGSKNFDAEVLRVVNSMPDWIPGRHNGENVDVRFNLPINFQL